MIEPGIKPVIGGQRSSSKLRRGGGHALTTTGTKTDQRGKEHTSDERSHRTSPGEETSVKKRESERLRGRTYLRLHIPLEEKRDDFRRFYDMFGFDSVANGAGIARCYPALRKWRRCQGHYIPTMPRPAVTLPKVEPIVPTKRSEPFNHPAWLFEPKYDGFRGI